MNVFRRRTRRGNEWASPHDRARARAAERLDWPLDPTEAEWLETHLVACPACRRRAADYADDRIKLRTLREQTPPPPRDLWARTAAAIELESERGGRAQVRGAPIGALSGVLVIAVVLGATLLSNTSTPTVVSPAEPGSFPPAAAASVVPGPAGTPLAVIAGDVPFIRREGDGTYGYGKLGVSAVCPKKGDIECPTVPDASSTALSLLEEPQTIIGSPDEDFAIIVSKPDESNASEVIVLVLPKPSADPGSADASPVPTATADASEPPASDEPPTSDAPDGSSEPSGSPDGSADPSAAPPSSTPDETGTPAPSPTPESIAIASGLVVVGQTEAYSSDGTWFAFTARPADDSHGPDIYVWRVGSERAIPVTDDHRSVFGSWAGDQLVGSRPSSGEGDETTGDTFLIDPETGTETALDQHGWRPVVAPSGDRALVFDGSVKSRGGHDIGPANGTLELRGWDARAGTASRKGEVVIEVDGTPFDTRWDTSGSAFAVWVQDPADSSFGRLSLFFVDPDSGDIVQPENAPREEPALPGFSIGKGRLAWSTPAGQGGEGSRVRIVAWTKDGVGSVETAPGDQVVVIR